MGTKTTSSDQTSLQGGQKKPDTQFYFWDNFGNSAPILTILCYYKQKCMVREREVPPPITPLLCNHIT